MSMASSMRQLSAGVIFLMLAVMSVQGYGWERIPGLLHGGLFLLEQRRRLIEPVHHIHVYGGGGFSRGRRWCCSGARGRGRGNLAVVVGVGYEHEDDAGGKRKRQQQHGRRGRDRNSCGIIDAGELQSVPRYPPCWGRQIDVSYHVKMLCSQDFASKNMNTESTKYDTLYDKLESMLQGESSEPHNLPLEFLRNITNDFSDEQLLGEGAFGTVHKGRLRNGKMIAVKKLKSLMPGVKDRQFENEANHLMRLKHPNIVLLVGWCSEIKCIPMKYDGKYICAEKSERLICLEYMPKGNLRGYLSAADFGLDWDTRYKIIKGICYGIRYLHEEWQLNAPIVHMDLKLENILLDNNMVPKIADFGLSRLFSEEKTWTWTKSCEGTLGYMSPEYLNRGIVSTKSDIFSLGVIILEVVTGHRDYPDDTGTPSEEYIEMVLHNWSQRKGVNDVSAVSLETVNYQQIRRCIQIGLECVKTDRSKRSTISQIIQALHGRESANSSNIKGVRSPANMVSSYNLLDTGTDPILYTVHGPQSRKRKRICGETWLMERLPKKHTPNFSIYKTFTVALHQWQKKTALRRIRVIFTTVFFVVLLKNRAAARRRFVLYPDIDPYLDLGLYMDLDKFFHVFGTESLGWD